MPSELAIFLSLFFGTFVSEDASVVAAGLLIASGKSTVAAPVLGALLGIFVSDLALAGVGRLARRGSHHPWVARFSPSEPELKRASAWFERHGLWVLIISRFVPGTRSLTGFTAGYLRVPALRFAFAFLAASSLWTILAVLAVARLGETAIRRWEAGAPLAAAVLVGVLVMVGAAMFTVKTLLDPRRRILLRARWHRLTRFEFWPTWVVYTPVVLHMALVLWPRHRRALAWTAVNPALPLGGLQGESKSDILSRLDRAGAPVAPWRLIPAGPVEERLRLVREFAGETWPLVLKPDVGERGTGVAVVRSPAEAESRLKASNEPLIAQKFIPGEEFGVFYVRKPGEPTGFVFSVTGKHLPEVTGDGVQTLAELILAHPRGPLLWKHFQKLHAARLEGVLPAGERVALTQLGNHCLGAVFLDRNHLSSPALAAALDSFMLRAEGLFFGRFDLRSPSEEALRRGEFTLFELNGVSSEPGHIYDPEKGTAVKGWQALIRQWSLAWEIGAANARQGAKVAGWRDLWKVAFPARTSSDRAG